MLLIERKDIKIAVHSRHQLIANRVKHHFIDFPYNTTLNANKTQIYYMLYNRVVVNSLPKPYETDCIDYKWRGYQSLAHCINKCRIRGYRQIWPHMWPGNYLAFNTSLDFKMLSMYDTLERYPYIDQNIGIKCKEICGSSTECKHEYYDLKLYKMAITWYGNYISIVVPDRPDLIYTHSPKILFEEFVSYIASYISLWFGFSVLMLPKVLNKCYQFIYRKITFYLNLIKIRQNIKVNVINVSVIDSVPHINVLQ